MALDHYVSQVHLRQWGDPKIRGLLHAIKKADRKQFTPKTRDVCRIEDGSTNPYLQPPRAIEDFLLGVEPKYPQAIEKLATGKIDRNTIFAVGGFAAYVLVCSPAGARLHAGPLKAIVEEMSRRLDKQGKFSKPPKVLGAESFTELLDSGKLKLNVDPKFPQALGIQSIVDHTKAFGNFAWDILINPFADSPFVTSDYPIAIEVGADSTVLNRIVPLSPTLAVRICPSRRIDTENLDFSFSGFKWRIRRLTRGKVRYYNKLIVQCAESMVFFNADLPWVPDFVERYAAFRTEPVSHRFNTGGKLALVNTEVISDDGG